ncbi:hypothetical protein A5320_10345 [Rheinheimera sp. SA_1]|nr:hypothetical protein A5320_10345 [Rheinheimera sp. SA_1]
MVIRQKNVAISNQYDINESAYSSIFHNYQVASLLILCRSLSALPLWSTAQYHQHWVELCKATFKNNR